MQIKPENIDLLIIPISSSQIIVGFSNEISFKQNGSEILFAPTVAMITVSEKQRKKHDVRHDVSMDYLLQNVSFDSEWKFISDFLANILKLFDVECIEIEDIFPHLPNFDITLIQSLCLLFQLKELKDYEKYDLNRELKIHGGSPTVTEEILSILKTNDYFLNKIDSEIQKFLEILQKILFNN